MPLKFSEEMFLYFGLRQEFENDLQEALGEEAFFEKIGGDEYDNSLEIYGVTKDTRFGETAQRLVYDAGFSTVYVNHTDGWETHYSWDLSKPFALKRGWRRRYVHDPSATTDRVIVGTPDPGYYEINYWPDGWDRNLMKKQGKDFFRIVTDPLEIIREDKWFL